MKRSSLKLALFLSLIAPVAHASTTVVATVNGEAITDDQLMAKAKPRLMKVLSQTYDIKHDAIEDIIDNKLLDKEAKAKKTTVANIINEIVKDVAPPTDGELKNMYELQKQRFGNRSFDDVSKALSQQMLSQKRQDAIGKHLDELRKVAKITINLERPKQDVATDDDPSEGPANAPITMIEFSDFQCPYCKRTRPTIDKILATYGDKVRYVFRDFPLSFHNQAKGAAIAANCANKQGKYWEYNRKLWNLQGHADHDGLVNLAKELKLDEAQFGKCLDDPAMEQEIEKDIADGSRSGVSGTPAYFINGIFLSGAQDFEAFKEIIDDELASKKP